MPRWIIAIAVLAGCATASENFDRQAWAKVSKEQASAECYDYINSAAGRGSSYYLCMDAKGWRQR